MIRQIAKVPSDMRPRPGFDLADAAAPLQHLHTRMILGPELVRLTHPDFCVRRTTQQSGLVCRDEIPSYTSIMTSVCLGSVKAEAGMFSDQIAQQRRRGRLSPNPNRRSMLDPIDP